MKREIFIYIDEIGPGIGGHTRSMLWSVDSLQMLGVKATLRLPKPVRIIKDMILIALRVPQATVINALGLAYRLPILLYIMFSILIKHRVFIYWHETSWVFNRLGQQKKIRSSIFSYLSKQSSLQHLVTCKRAKAFCESVGICSERIHIIGECIKPIRKDRLKFQHLDREDNRRTVMALGSIQLRKGTDLFCEAAIIVCKKVRNIDFVWVGPNIEFDPGLYETCLTRVKAAGFEDRIRFYGFLNDPYSFLATADIFVLCSRDDPMPLSNLEAMLLSKTIITFDVGGAPEALGGCGHVLGKPDSAELARKILELASLPRDALIRKDARDRVMAEFMPLAFAERLKRLIVKDGNQQIRG